MIDWKKYVEHIYIVDYINTNNNINKHFNEELERVGIDRKDTSFVTNFVNINTPLYKKLFETFNTNNYNNYTYAFDCSIGHYYCMKLAQSNNYKRILILENDCIFYDDLNYIKEVLELVLKLYERNEIDLFCGNLGVMFDNALNINYENKSIKKYLYDRFAAGAAFNIYNNKAYNVYINQIENYRYSVIDMYINIYSLENIKIYYSPIMICVQKYWDFLMENLYEHYNMYEPSHEQIIQMNKDRYEVKWADNRNLHKLLYNVIEHYNLIEKYKEIYEDCKKHF